MESPRPSEARAAGASSSTRNDKGVGSGSSEDSMASELGRLSEENAHYRRKISDLMGKAPAVPSHTRTSSGTLGGSEKVILSFLPHDSAREAYVHGLGGQCSAFRACCRPKNTSCC